MDIFGTGRPLLPQLYLILDTFCNMQGLALVPYAFFSSTPALLRDALHGIRDQAAQIELTMVTGTFVSSGALHKITLVHFSS
jgi:hypothetical protein